MARSAKPRKPRNTRKPVTIDLEAEAVSEEAVQETNAAEAAAAEPVADMAKDEAAKDTGSKIEEDADTPTSAPAEKKSKSSAIGGGVIGGLLALIGAGALQWGGVLPSFAPAQEQVDIAPLQSNIQTLNAKIDELATRESVQAVGLPPASAKAIQDAVTASEQAQAKIGAVEQTLQSLGEKVTTVESSIAAGDAGENAGLEALATRLAAAEGQLSEIAAGSDVDGTANVDIAALKEQIASLQNTVAAQASELAAANSAVNEQLSTVQAQISETQNQLEAGASGASVAGAIASAGLKSAIDRGGSFMTELEAYASVAKNDTVVNELRNYAASGVMTLTQLSDAFPAIANKIVATGVGVDEQASLVDRLAASARSLVQVRPVGEVEGDGPGEIAARLEQDLKSGDLSSALSEWETLPDAAKEVSSDFAESLRARLAVDAMVAEALTGAMANTQPAAEKAGE